MRERIERAIGVLVGRSLWNSTRAADLASFQFGQRRELPGSFGRTRTVGEYALHVQCAWRIAREDRVIVGSHDLRYPANYTDTSQAVDPDFDWDRDPNGRDSLLASLFENGAKQFLVEAVTVGSAGLLHLRLADSLCFDIMPDDSIRREQWRFFQPDVEAPHLVVTSSGIE
jgi:hypothetical protein